MKRRALVFWLGALAAMTLAACGGDDPSLEPDAGKAPSADAASSDTAPSDSAGDDDAAATDSASADAAGDVAGVDAADGVGADAAGPADSAGADSDVAENDAAGSDAGADDVATSDAVADASPDAVEDAAVDAGQDVTGDAGANDVSADTAPPQVKQKDPLALPQAAFTEVTKAYGVDPKTAHAYCAGVGDLDGDGDDDLVFVEMDALKNKGQLHVILLGDAQPKHVKSTLSTWNLVPDLGCTVIDQDGDGKEDLWLGGSSGAAIYLSDGKGGFVEATAQLLPPLFNAKASSFAPVDLNGDGALDLVVGAGSHPNSCKNTGCVYDGAEFQCKVSPAEPLSSVSEDRVLIRTATGALVDETAKWKLPLEGGYATYIAAWDLDLDGDQDLLIGTDFHTPWILRREGAGFVHEGVKDGLHGYAHAMGWGVADFDGDGALDVLLADLGPTALYRQQPASPKKWHDISYSSDLAALTVGTSDWTPLVADFDHDGWEDILLGVSMAATKSIFLKMLDGCSSQSVSLKAVDVLMLNQQGKGWQASRTQVTDCGEVSAVAQATIDLDGDGDLDVVQVRPGCVFPFGVVRILRNDLKKKGGAITLRLKGKGSNTAAVGARVTASIGGKLRQRQVVASGGLGGGGSLSVHFGLGGAAEAKDLKVFWPGGGVSAVGSLKSGQSKTVQQP